MKQFVLLLMILAVVKCYAQDATFENAFRLGISNSEKINNRLALKMAVEFRALPSSSFLESINLKDRKDFQLALERKVYGSIKLAAGAMYRFSHVQNKQRLFQQMGFLQRTLSRVVLAHRFKVDETFSNDPVEYRLRYRFGFEMPIRGLRLDIKELYLSGSSEFLGKIQGEKYVTELRLSARIGYLFENNNKAEFQLEYRLEEPQNMQEQLLIFGFNYYFK